MDAAETVVHAVLDEKVKIVLLYRHKNPYIYENSFVIIQKDKGIILNIDS